MHPEISEFSYGYALTDEMVNTSSSVIEAAPVFPTLVAEGKKGGGFDVKLPFSGAPIFLQFKLSHLMKRETAKEARDGRMVVPFYRMHLRPRRLSVQHQLLLDLEAKGNAVYYVAPLFHLPEELNDAFLTRTVCDRSVFIKPSAIGQLMDDDPHSLAFDNGPMAWLYSEPRKIEGTLRARTVIEELLPDEVESRQVFDGSADSVVDLSDLLAEIVGRRSSVTTMDSSTSESLADRSPRVRANYLLRAYFGCEMLIARRRGSDTPEPPEE